MAHKLKKEWKENQGQAIHGAQFVSCTHNSCHEVERAF